jgi:CheY-like chemotaxis protein
LTSTVGLDAERFLGELAHDLRNLLEGMDAALSRELADPSLRDVAYREIYDLILKTESYLDRQRLLERRLELRPERVDLVAATGRCLQRLAPYLGERALRSAPESGDCSVHFDARGLDKILDRLVYACVKLTGKGDAIHFSFHKEGNLGRMALEIPEVSPEARVESLLSPDETRSWALWGAREMARIQGGDLKWDEGSRFRLELPRGAAARPREPAHPADAAKLRVLIVDDNDDSARSLAMLLALAGHEANVRSNGRDALVAVRELRPDVVLLDLGLPDMDGYDVCRALRDDPSASGLRLVAVSGRGDDSRKRSEEAGFDAHLLKPVDQSELLRTLSSPSAPRKIR